MDGREFITKAKKIVADKCENVTINQVVPVWGAKILKNNKGLFIIWDDETNSTDGKYFEVTYNGNKDEFYIDIYAKQENIKIKFTDDDKKETNGD